MSEPREYGIVLRYLSGDGLYQASVFELRDIRVYSESRERAYSGALEVIEAAQRIFAEKRKKFPEPGRAPDGLEP